jgi:hypothetical protein
MSEDSPPGDAARQVKTGKEHPFGGEQAQIQSGVVSLLPRAILFVNKG